MILFIINGNDCFYDLSNGSLDSEKIGVYDEDIPIFSAERFLIDIECLETAIVERVFVNPGKIVWEGDE